MKLLLLLISILLMPRRRAAAPLMSLAYFTLYIASLTSVFAEQVGVSACISHQQHKLLVVLVPDEKPVGNDVALPVAFILTVKDMGPILFRESAFRCQDVKDFRQQLLVVAPFETTLQRTLELASVAQRVLHALHCFIKSSTLLAS